MWRAAHRPSRAPVRGPAAKLRRLVIAADPTAAATRAATEIKGRRVQAFLNDNQLAALCGYELAPHRAAAAMERLTAIARAAKAAGDPTTGT